jgi:hypothetical protein
MQDGSTTNYKGTTRPPAQIASWGMPRAEGDRSMLRFHDYVRGPCRKGKKSMCNLGESPSRLVNLVQTFSGPSNRASSGRNPFRYAVEAKAPLQRSQRYLREELFRRSYVDKHANKPIRLRLRSHSGHFPVSTQHP